LSDGRGADAISKIYDARPQTPIVALISSDEKGVECYLSQAGLQSFLIKGRFSNRLLAWTVRYAIEHRKIELAQREMRDVMDTETKEYTKQLRESEERFRIIFESSPVAIILTNEEERIVSWNKFTEDLLNMSRDDLYLKPVSFLYPREEWEKIRSLNIKKTGIRQQLETVIIRKDGSQFDVDVSINVLKDADGEVTGSIGIIRDISERKKAERVLKDKTRRSSVVFKLLQDLRPNISSTDMLGLIVKAAGSLVRADTASIVLLDEDQNKLRIAASESQGLKVDDFILQPSLDEKTSITGWVIKNKKPLLLPGNLENDERFSHIKWKGTIKSSINVPLIFRDSVKGTLNLNIIASDYVFTEDDMQEAQALANHAAVALKNSGLYKSLKDKHIEELKSSNEKLTKINRELEQARDQLIESEKMSAIGQLASGVAHEINNPLSGILGNVQIIKMDLKSGVKPGDLDELLTVIEDSAKRCKSITQNLLDFSRTKQDVFAAFDVHKALHSTVVLIGHTLKDSNIEIKKKFDEALPMTLGNINQIQQVFLNMFTNAKWAIEKKEEKAGSVTVETRKIDDKFIEVSFSDTGVDMSKEGLKKIFEPFYTTKEVGKGTGLGLSICYEIMQKHNGELRVESEEGKGTTFRIKLPIA
ncbi:MAG: ATP-binding protein, partial [Thermodesulfobacteriota bacterium]